MHHTIFISGPHGTGKTTLIKNLLESDACFVPLDVEIDFSKELPSLKHMSHYEKTLTRMLYRIARNHRAIALSKQLPHNVIVTDRGGLCSLAYANVYLQLGWITLQQHTNLHSFAQKFILDLPTVILNPPIEVILQRLQSRKQQRTRVERDCLFQDEDSEEFIRLLWNEFESYAKNPSVLVIRDNSIEDMQRVVQWANLPYHRAGLPMNEM